jgi:hypothetical protein
LDPPLALPAGHACANPYAQEKEMVERDLAVMSVPLIGVKVHSSDLSVLGSLAMAVLALWFYYSVRRENHVVDAIANVANAALDNPTPESINKARYLFDAIAHYFVFTTTTERDTPKGEKPRVGARLAVKALMYMPIWVPCCLGLGDVVTAVVPLKLLRVIPSNENIWMQLDFFERLELVLRIVIAGSVVWHNYIRCSDVVRFDLATRKELVALEDRLTALTPAGPVPDKGPMVD